LSRFETSDNLIFLDIDRIEAGLASTLADSLARVEFRNKPGAVIDLRGARGSSSNEKLALIELLSDYGLPMVVLIDGRTSGQAELLAQELNAHLDAVTIGSSTRGLALATDTIRLFSGAEVVLSPHNRLSSPADLISEDDSSSDSSQPNRNERGLVPEIAVDPKQQVPLVADLTNRGLLFRFIVELEVDSLPAPQSEEELLKSFYRFLVQEEYRFAPLEDLLREMASVADDDVNRKVIARMQTKAEAMSTVTAADYPEEILEALICEIIAVRSGKPPNIRMQLRAGDEVLERAIEVLQEQSAI
jgi:hypothetical protein